MKRIILATVAAVFILCIVCGSAYAQMGQNFSVKVFRATRGPFPTTTLTPGTQTVGQPVNGLTFTIQNAYRGTWRISIQSDGLKHISANYYITKIYANPAGTITVIDGRGNQPVLSTGARRINSEYSFINGSNSRGSFTYTPSLSDGLYVEISGTDNLIAGQYEGTLLYSLYLGN